MHRIPYILIALLILLAIIASVYIATSTCLDLNDSQRISNVIGLFVCMGALISAIFVINSYIQTNRVFLLSQRPSLLIQVKGQHIQTNAQNNEFVPHTFVHYSNTSQNDFDDLTILLKVQASNKIIDLSDLFKPKMFMAASDKRHRKFETLALLSQRGVDIESETRSGNKVLLSTGYTFTFNNKLEEKKGPVYKWNGQIRNWELE